LNRKIRLPKEKIARRFIVIEGVYYNYGDIVPLPKIMELKEKYKWRLMLEDSGIGLIGNTGRGTCEYYGISPKSVDLITGNLEQVTSSVGGFCSAPKKIVFHLRLNATGYVYSASLPPLLAAASVAALDLIDEQPQLIANLARNVQFFFKGLSSISGISVTSVVQSPIIHVRLSNSTSDRYTDEQILQKIVVEAGTQGILLTRAKYVHSDEKFLPPPSIRISVSAAHTVEQLTKALDGIKYAVTKSLARNFDSSQGISSVSRRSTGTY